MEWLKINDNDEIEFVSEEVKLVPEVQALMVLKYNKSKGDIDGRRRHRALNELKYMYLAYSPKSPYRDYTPVEAIIQAKSDCQLPTDWEESTELKALIIKFKKGSQNKVTRLLNTALLFLEKLEAHLNTIDLNERNLASGALIHKASDIINTLQKLPGLAETIQQLEVQARLGTIKTVGARGDQETGWMDDNNASELRKRKDDSSGESEE